MAGPTPLTIAAALALGGFAAVATAAPTVAPSGASPSVQEACPTPDAATCKKKGYLESTCGKKHEAVCGPHVEAALEAYHTGHPAPTLKMLKPRKDEMPRDVESGKYFRYKHPSASASGRSTLRSVYHKTEDPLLGLHGRDMSAQPPVTRDQKVDPTTAAKWHRKPEWMEPSLWEVRSCEEYAYERSFGITRFIDAASACLGDFECVFDVAYMQSSPGISDRVLRTSDGNPLPKQLELLTGTVPKNEMFVHGREFVRSDGLEALPGVEVITALEAALETGKTYYKIGGCGGSCTAPRKFKTMWDWHKFLHDKVANVSQAENEEYMRRLAQFRNLMDQWNAAVEWEHSLLQKVPLDEQMIVLPLDMRAHDPFERFEIEQQYLERGRVTRQALQAKFGAGVVNKSMPAIRKLAKKQVHGSLAPAPALGVLAAPVSTQGPKASQTGQTGTTSTAPAGHGGVTHAGSYGQTSECLKGPNGWGLESGFKGPISCRIGEFLRAEWKRKLQGHKSCLDLNNFACDWTPQMFQASVLDKIPALDQQLADREYCKAWDDAQTFKNPVPPVAEVKRRLDKARAEDGPARQAVQPYDRGTATDGKGRKLGKFWEGGDYLGNKKLFAVGYDYDVGWEVDPRKRTATSSSDDLGFVCELSGRARANTGFDAWIIDTKVEVVDGQVAARANHGGEGKVSFAAHLEMFDQTVFSTGLENKGKPNEKVKWKVAQTFGDAPASGFMIQVPSFKPRFDVYVGVPISGQMWGELLFGSTLDLRGSASSTCDADNPKFSVGASYGPLFGAFGLGQVGVGIAGVASAGVRASLNLILVHLPVSFDMGTVIKSNKPYVKFASDLGLTLATLSGRVSLYIEFLTFDEEFELFRWKGFGPTTATLMPLLSAEIPMSTFTKDAP